MKPTVSLTTICSAVLVVLLVWAIPTPAEETAGQILAKINKLSPENRREALMEEAKAEGEVTWYSSVQAVQIGPIVEAFNNRFPLMKSPIR
jgi:hypothetical protein